MSYFELTMLICFGVAWPFSIWKSFKSRTTKGKSLPFLVIVLVGYVSGVVHKIIYNPDPVVVLYMLNGCMVMADIGLFVYNRKHEYI